MLFGRKTVIAVSEMYLPKDLIHELLENAGYNAIGALYFFLKPEK